MYIGCTTIQLLHGLTCHLSDNCSIESNITKQNSNKHMAKISYHHIYNIKILYHKNCKERRQIIEALSVRININTEFYQIC